LDAAATFSADLAAEAPGLAGPVVGAGLPAAAVVAGSAFGAAGLSAGFSLGVATLAFALDVPSAAAAAGSAFGATVAGAAAGLAISAAADLRRGGTAAGSAGSAAGGIRLSCWVASWAFPRAGFSTGAGAGVLADEAAGRAFAGGSAEDGGSSAAFLRPAGGPASSVAAFAPDLPLAPPAAGPGATLLGAA